MSEAITMMIAGSFQHDTTSVIKISIAGGALQTVTVPTGWYRVWLASTGGGGTAHTDPWEYLAKLKALLDAASPGNNWTVRMGSSGLVQLTYTGATYAITWDGTAGTDAKGRNVLGFTANIGTTASGTYSTATNPPCFVVAAASRRNDTYWQTKQTTASSELESGVVSALGTGTPRATRGFDALFLPADTSSVLTLSLSPYYSPAYPDATRYTAPLTVPTASLNHLYSWHDFLHGMIGRELGAAITTQSGSNLSTFALTQAGTVTTFDKCYLTSRCAGNLRTSSAQENWHHRKHVLGIELSFVSQASL